MFITKHCARLEIIALVLSGRAWHEWQVCGDRDKSDRRRREWPLIVVWRTSLQKQGQVKSSPL